MDSDAEGKRQKLDFHSRAKELNQKLLLEFQMHDLNSLTSTATWTSFTRPIVGKRMKSYKYMGRECTGTIVNFLIQEPYPGAPLIIDDGEDMTFVVGTPGFGKTTALSAAFGYLHHKFAEESPRKSRILYLKGTSFVTRPNRSLLRAILLAFADEEVQLDQNDYQSLVDFLEAREEEIYLLLDDGNAMDPDLKESKEGKVRKATPEMRAAARANLEELKDICSILVCAYVRSFIIENLKTDKGERFKRFVGGFTDEERASYLKFIKRDLSDADLEVTGSVPRLLDQFFFRRDNMTRTLHWYEEGIREYIDGALGSEQKRWEVFQLISGNLATPEELPDVMRSRCFFQGRDQRVECLTTHLKSYALSYFATQLRRLSESSAAQEIDKWLSTIPGDTNVARIGWNAEAATIAAFSRLGLKVDCSSFMKLGDPGQGDDPAQKLTQMELRDLLRRVHAHVARRQEARCFLAPVQELVRQDVWQTYQQEIAQPMDLRTISEKLERNAYRSIDEFEGDMKLTFENALKFNCPGDPVHNSAVKLKEVLEEKLVAERSQCGMQKRTTLEFKAESVVLLEGKFEWSMLKAKKPMLLIPKAFNHYGADLYFVDDGKVVIVQISCCKNAKDTHLSTRALMESCPADEKRRKLLLWVLPGVAWDHKLMGKGYEDVQVSFGKVLPQLECIDIQCLLLRGIDKTDCVYCGGFGASVRCIGCFYWSHEACARKDLQLGVQDPLGPFQCLYCRSKGERRVMFT